MECMCTIMGYLHTLFRVFQIKCVKVHYAPAKTSFEFICLNFVLSCVQTLEWQIIKPCLYLLHNKNWVPWTTKKYWLVVVNLILNLNYIRISSKSAPVIEQWHWYSPRNRRELSLFGVGRKVVGGSKELACSAPVHYAACLLGEWLNWSPNDWAATHLDEK